MVLVHPNPPPGQGFNHFYSYHFGGDPMVSPGMKTAENNNFHQTPSSWSTGAGVEDPGKKVRKPYTITKSRESWSEQEHDKFLEALHLFDRDWKKIEAFVGSKTVIQIRSHAQKYFMKVQKNGTSEHVPPPRPKRKAAHPYPHKAPKKVASQPSGPLSSSAPLDSKHALGPQAMSVPANAIGSAPLYSWSYSGAPTGSVSPMSKDVFALSGGTMMRNWSSNSNEIAPRIRTSDEATHQVKESLKEKGAIPDFAQVYSFIASLFDTGARDHLEKLKKMDPITVETVLMLVENLSINLVSPEFENHRRLLYVENDSVCSESSA